MRVRCAAPARWPEVRYALESLAFARRLRWTITGPDDGGDDGEVRLNYGRACFDRRPGSINVPCAEGRVENAYAWYAPGPVPFLAATRDDDAPGAGRVVLSETGSDRPLMVTDPTRRTATFGFDVIAGIFRHLSCAAEYEHERTHRPLHSYARRLPLDPVVVGTPVVNHYFAALERAVAEATGLPPEVVVPPTPYPGGARFAVCLTHDVDAVTKTWSLRLKRLAFDARHVARGGHPTGGRGVQARLALRRLVSPDAYWHFERIAELESRFGWRSTYFVYARERVTSRSGWVRWLYDPGYDVAGDIGLRAALRQVRDRGGEVALHGSYESYASEPRLAAEKAALESAAGASVRGNRQHWLRLSLADTWRLQEAVGLEYDATLGFNDLPGFRAGIAAPFHPWDHEARRAMRLVEIPTVLMDSTLFDHLGLGPAEAERAALAVLEPVAACGGAAAVIWHQQVFGDDYGWGALYERLLEWLRARGGVGLTCDELLRCLDR